MKIILLNIVLFLVVTNSVSYSQLIDQETILLEKKLKKTKNTKEEIDILLQLFLKYEFVDSVKARKINDRTINLAKAENDLLALARAYNHKGFLYEDKGNLNKAILMYKKTLKYGVKLHHNEIISNSLNNIGALLKNQGKHTDALKCYHKCLRLELLSSNKNNIAGTYVNIGEIYREQQNYSKALWYYVQAEKLWKNGTFFYEKAVLFNNIGLVYKGLFLVKASRKSFLKSVLLYQKANMHAGVATALMNIGLSFNEKDHPDSSLFYTNKALYYSKKSGDSLSIIESLHGFSKSLMNNKKYIDAILNLHICYRYFKTNDLLTDLMEVCFELSNAYERIGSQSKGLLFLKEHLTLKNNILNSEQNGQIAEMEARFNSVQKDKEIAENKAKLRLKMNQQVFLLAGLISFLIFSIFTFKRYKITQKQNRIIKKQKQLVENKNKKIFDSITYAKRIQSAIFPSEKLIKKHFPESFIIYKPKDIVAGDFYWFEVIEDTIFFAAADCTGHGVPGALVSVVCNNALNRSVKEFGLKNTGEILDKTREIVISEFEKSDEEVKDGMDISLCALDTKTNILKWSGANNPLWILRKNASGFNELIEFKADKQPIGKHYITKPFSMTEVKLQKDDAIYIFTDGFQDQFGGEKEKKFHVEQMRDLILSLSTKAMEEQQKKLEKSFETWKGDLEQVDDVCVIGVRI